MSTLKQRIEEELNDLRADFGDEEVDNTLEVLNGLDDELTNMDKWDETLITRLIENKELLKEIYSIRGEYSDLFD